MVHQSKFPAVAVFVLSLSACLGDLFGGGNEPALDGTQTEMPETKFPQCTGLHETIDYQMLLHSKPFRNGGPGETFEEAVPVSPNGCVRYMHRVENGRETRRGTIVATGFVHAVLSADGHSVEFKETEYYRTKEDLTPTSSHLEIDSDGDGIPEEVMTSSYDAEGLIEQVITRTDHAGKVVLSRRTMRRVNADNIRWIEEKRVGGELKVVRDQVAPSEMEAKLGPAGDCYQNREYDAICSSDDMRQAMAALLEGVARGSECMKKNKASDEDTDLLAHLVKTRASHLLIKCVESNKISAQMQAPGQDPYGIHVLTVNVGMFRCENANTAQSTMFHEALHLIRGPHADTEGAREELFKKGKMSEQAFIYSDPIWSCEGYCFGGLETRCSCASCLQTTTCDERCEAAPSCEVQGADGGYTMSEAVGALCTPASESVEPSWHNTKAACESNCSGGSCKSYALSCNAACN